MRRRSTVPAHSGPARKVTSARWRAVSVTAPPSQDRPFQMIIFSGCRNVVLRDFLITNHPSGQCLCRTAMVSHVGRKDLVQSSGAQQRRSRFHVHGSNVLVSGTCDIRTGMTALFSPATAITSISPDTGGARSPSEKHQCHQLHDGLPFGPPYGSAGSIRNPMRNYRSAISRYTIPTADRHFFFQPGTKGSIENLTFHKHRHRNAAPYR